MSDHETPLQPVAIVGYSCRLSGHVTSPQDLWELCHSAQSGWGPIPKERFSFESYHHPNPSKKGTFNPSGGYFLNEDVARFDAPFFNVTVQEAISMDPQQRMLLECSYEAFESAGFPKEDLTGRSVGVFVGASFSDYDTNNMRDLETVPMFHSTGCANALQSNRLSYYFDLRGPSFTVDTACSSSLVALHQAMQSLRKGESQEALVGGCHLNITPDLFVSMSASQLFNDEGKTYSLDERAKSGYARGEGAGVVILKPLDAAIRDGNTIRAVIANSGVNQDGRTQGITLPNSEAQEQLIRRVYREALLNPHDCGFVEMHGTGTKAGDPLEAAGVHRALGLGAGRSPTDPLYIGSSKSNFGHLEGASGMVSIIKAAMMLEKGQLLPNADFRAPNPEIPMKEWNMIVPPAPQPWPCDKKYVSVSNYGFGGTNAHVVLQKYDIPSKESVSNQDQNPKRKLFVISANDKESLRTRVSQISAYIDQHPNDAFDNLAYSLGTKISNLCYRVGVSASSPSELTTLFSQFKGSASRVRGPPTIGFVFTGQGAQWAQMGVPLIDEYPVFASAMYRADQCLRELGAPFSLLEILRDDAETSEINSPHLSQPACSALQIALVDLLQSWGIRPASVVGHSSGEIGAAYAAGAYDLETAMTLAYCRGEMTQLLKTSFPDIKGTMIAIGAGAETVKLILSTLTRGYATIACVNSPSSVTVSGDVSAIDELETILQDKDMFNRRLKVDVAYHSDHMKNIAGQYLKSIESIQPSSNSGATVFYSSVTGELTPISHLGPDYWVSNLTSPVLFPNALGNMVGDEAIRPNLIIEVGPHSALKGPILDTLKSLGPALSTISYSATILRKSDPVKSLLDTAATSNALGAAINMSNVNFPSTGARECVFLNDLPRYPWQHDTRYWHESRISRQHLARDDSRNDILGVLANYSNELEPTWRNIVRLEDIPWLSEHKMQGLAVYPMTGYLSMAIEAAKRRAVQKNIQFSHYELREIVVRAALVLNGETDVETTITLRPFTEGTRGSSDVWDEFRICSWTTSRGWTEHCSGMIRVRAAPKEQAITISNSTENEQENVTALINEIRTGATSKIDSQYMYRILTELGADYGPLFQGIENCMASPSFSYGDLFIKNTKAVMPKEFEAPLVIHPAFLDCLLQVTWPVLGKGGMDIEALHMPTSIKRMVFSCNQPSQPGQSVKAYGMKSVEKGPMRFDIFATPSTSNTPLITVEGLTMTPINDSGVDETKVFKKLCYKFQSHKLSEIEQEIAKSHDDGYVNVQATGSTMDSRDITLAEFGTSNGLAQKLKGALNETFSWTPSVTSLNGLLVNNKKYIIILQTGSQSLRDLTRVTFQSIKRKLLDASNILWVYRTDNPDGQMAVGLSRTLRQEALAQFATLGLSSADFTTDPLVPILAAMNALWPFDGTAGCRDAEFISQGSELLVQRAVEDDAANAFVHTQTHAMAISTQLYSQPGRRLKLQIGNPGALDSLYFEDDHKAGPLNDDEIELEVKATGVNFKDIVVSMGELSQPYIGVECTGIVSSVGADVKDLQVGQRVMAMTEGAYSTYARCRSTSAAVIPDDMSFEVAATVPVVYCTAYYALFDLGRLTAGERVLIHAGAGGVGQAAIMLAQMAGADVFVTVGSLGKKQFLMDTYGIPDGRIFYSRDHSFARGIKRATEGKGIDVVLNSLAGELLRESWEIVAPFGRFIEIGKADITKNTRLDMNPFEWNITFASVDLTKVAEFRPHLMKRLLNDVCRELADKNTVKPISPVTTFSITDIEKAFRTLQTGKSMGKLVVCPQDGDVAKCTSANRGSLFRPDASYILVGGTGGIGRSIAKFMSSKGAKCLVLVSRSASLNDNIKALVKDVGANGTQIVLKACDISNPESVNSLIKEDIKDLPPVRGVIHGTVVLRDMIFERMALEDFTAVTAGKVEGAWNLHHALVDCSLDFFVAISSVAGVIGGRGQGAYAASNVFLDGFMEYRRRLGLPGVSIDLSAVTDVGLMTQADAQRQENITRNYGSSSMNESEVLAMISAAISGALDSSCSGQCINGLSFTQEPAWASDAKFDILRDEFKTNQLNDSGGQSVVIPLREQLQRASSRQQALQVCFDALATKIAQLLVVPIEEMDPSITVSALGIDSLSALEIRNWIGREAGAKVQVLELLSCGPLMALAEIIIAKSTFVANMF
ncbi:unnamed protein product [Penicillium salamii]|nr:unnamed protein product [Penicillium salamii]CAG8286105.1 unnamed protein product [Penicillium salamii]CAG8398843.1 unnamed protein product [Penicillium salamii]